MSVSLLWKWRCRDLWRFYFYIHRKVDCFTFVEVDMLNSFMMTFLSLYSLATGVFHVWMEVSLT